MLSKNQIKLIASLRLKKFRKTENLFVVEGAKIVYELLASDWNIKVIYGTEEFFQTFKNSKLTGDVELVRVTEDELQKISSLTTPQQTLAIAEIPLPKPNINFDSGLFLLLDGINDPGNLGTIIRIADWFGISEIICSENTVDCYNSKVVQASMGSLFRINVSYNDLTSLLKDNAMNKKLPVYGTVLNGKNIFDEKLSDSGFILIGNESTGIDPKNLECISHPITIPSFNGSNADSLNAAVAAGIVCAEFRRR